MVKRTGRAYLGIIAKLTPTAPLRPIAGRIYDPGEFYDEALTPDGRPRPAYRTVLATSVDRDLQDACSLVSRSLEEMGARFGSGPDSAPFRVDPIPRIIPRAEWDELETGLVQRARALNAFITDIYGQGTIVSDGVVPARVIREADHYELAMTGVEVGTAPATVIGFDLVRGSDGKLLVLEDNLRTPSGLTYAAAGRRACDAWLEDAIDPRRLSLAPAYQWLGAALRAAAPDGRGDPATILLSDGPTNTAWYEHVELARELDIPIALPAQIEQSGGRLRVRLEDGRARPVDVVYRRTDEDRLHDEGGKPTWVAEALLEPLRRGTLGVVNGFGAGVADDKLTHAYVEDMVRFYLAEEPRIKSVPTYDLDSEPVRARARRRLDELVVKPRSASGGLGVVVGSQAEPGELRRVRRLIAKSPESFVAQEIVPLSRCPTVCDGRLEPRHVDLRAFAITTAERTRIVPGGLTRVALERGSLVVNSSRRGGGKDTWVLR